MSADEAVAYLETDPHYLENGWKGAVIRTLVELCRAFDPDPLTGDECLCVLDSSDSDYLCTGDGFRWNPLLPVLRFTS